MYCVIIALLPVSIFSIYMYGARALAVLLVSVAVSMLAEFCFRKLTHKDNRVRDGSAAITGLLLALICPPSVPFWQLIIGDIFAIVVAKEFFGGLGANVFNPALAGRAFMLMSFPAPMTTWTLVHAKMADTLKAAADATTGATPLGAFKEAVKAGTDAVTGATVHFGSTAGFDAAHAAGFASYNDMIHSLFFGTYAGSMGETSVLLILIGAIFLLCMRVIDWKTPVSFICAAFVMSFVVGEDPLFMILSGGLIFGACFMATDYVTTPVSAPGQVIFGIGCGIITLLIRRFGSYPEGVMFSILIMNMVTPFLNRILHKKYGWVPPKPAAPAANKGGAK
jgi:electron transport complex protein RnfD